MTSKKISIITDSTCDIPALWRVQYHIQIVPLTIIWGDEQFLDGVDITPDAFYARLPDSRQHPTTSQPTPQNFREAYERAASEGAEEILVFTLSSAMSGTHQSAVQAAEGAPVPVTVIDSKSNSMGLGWQVLAAVRTLGEGKGKIAALEAVAKVHKNLAYSITLDTMDYLSQGGRVGGATIFLGNLLKIKPLIYVDHKSGKVEPGIPARTRSRAIDGLIKDFFHRLHGYDRLHVAVLHNGVPDEAEQLAERIHSEYAPVEMFISLTSPILGAHTGPRAMALCGYNEL